LNDRFTGAFLRVSLNEFLEIDWHEINLVLHLKRDKLTKAAPRLPAIGKTYGDTA
jgi:hypothetical protein